MPQYKLILVHVNKNGRFSDFTKAPLSYFTSAHIIAFSIGTK